MRLSCVIFCDENKNINKTVNSVKNVCDEVVVVPISEIIDLDKENYINILLKYDKEFGNLKDYICEKINGDYVMIMFENEELLDSKIKDKMHEEADQYYVNIVENRPEGEVVFNEIRILEGKALKFDNLLPQKAFEEKYILDITIKNKAFDNEYERREKALRLLGHIMPYDCSNFNIKYQIALYWYISGEYERANLYFKDAYNLSRDKSSTFYRDMSASLIKEGQFSEALFILREGIGLFKDNGELYYNLGKVNLELEKYDDAFKCLSMAKETLYMPDDIHTIGLNTFKNSQLAAEIYFKLDDYENAVKYYCEAAVKSGDIAVYVKNIIAIMAKLNYSSEKIEENIKKLLELNEKELYDLKYQIYNELEEWQSSLNLVRFSPDNYTPEKEIKCLYKLKLYDECLDKILDNFDILDKRYYGMMAICCIILNLKIQPVKKNQLITLFKRNECREMLDIYRTLIENKIHKSNNFYLKELCKILLNSSDSKCVSPLEKILQEVKDIDFMELANEAYERKFYYLSELIINIHCDDNKYDFPVLNLLAKLAFKTGNIEKCQEYISHALIIRESTEIRKLQCSCKIRECMDILQNCDGSNKSLSLIKACNILESAEEILNIQD